MVAGRTCDCVPSCFQPRRGRVCGTCNREVPNGPLPLSRQGCPLGRSLASSMLDWAGDDALVVADQDSPEEPFHIIRLSIDTGETRQLTSPPPHSSGDLCPVVSPDGQTLAFTRGLAPAPSDIYVLPVTGGEPRRVTFDESVITALTWSEDGGSIVFSSERGAMAGAGSLWRVRVDASTARPEPEQLRGIGQKAGGPVIARRGRRLAYVETSRDVNLWRVAATGEGPAQPFVSSTREEQQPRLFSRWLSHCVRLEQVRELGGLGCEFRRVESTAGHVIRSSAGVAATMVAERPSPRVHPHTRRKRRYLHDHSRRQRAPATDVGSCFGRMRLPGREMGAGCTSRRIVRVCTRYGKQLSMSPPGCSKSRTAVAAIPGSPRTAIGSSTPNAQTRPWRSGAQV